MVVLRGLGARIASYIALFAILMLTAAPTISQHLQSRAHTSVMPPVVSSHEHHTHHVSPVTSQQSTESPMHSRYQPHHMMLGGVMGDLLACGYCELLIHVPFILWAFFPALHRFLSIRRQPIVRWQQQDYCPAPITFYPARGPPTGQIVR